MINYQDYQSNSDYFYNSIPYIVEGQVIDNDDPDQMGRVRIWIPSIDGDNFIPNDLTWAEYASPLFGFTIDRPVGANSSPRRGHKAYGIWAIPKVGATVLVFFLNGNPHRRFYFASTLRLHRNRSMPAGRNIDFIGNPGPTGDAGDTAGNLIPMEPAFSNIREQFQNNTQVSEAKTRGGWERQVAQPGDNKDGLDGYAKNPVEDGSRLDPQTYCWVTPGNHAIIMQDNPEDARLRIKTAEGNQVIFDDANERIYVSTAKGKTWIELDQDGHIHIFGSSSISVRSGEDINLFADRDINIEAKRAMNIKALGGDIRLDTAQSFHLQTTSDIIQTACGNFHTTSEKNMKLTSLGNLDTKITGNVRLTSMANIDLRAGGNITQTGTRIDLNGPEAAIASTATCASRAMEPPIIPGHEPWSRPISKLRRGNNWKK